MTIRSVFLNPNLSPTIPQKVEPMMADTVSMTEHIARK